jgi:hypothetical protein
LLHRGGANLLGEFVDFRHDVGNLVKRETEILVEHEPFLDHGGALIHVLDGLARFFLNPLDQLGDFLG